jgi:hypothetical protein
MTVFRYEIRVDETLDSHWSEWFDGMEILPSSEGSNTPGTLLSGSLPDQAALFGILSQLRSLNLTLIEVRRINRATNPVDHEVDLER